MGRTLHGSASAAMSVRGNLRLLGVYLPAAVDRPSRSRLSPAVSSHLREVVRMSGRCRRCLIRLGGQEGCMLVFGNAPARSASAVGARSRTRWPSPCPPASTGIVRVHGTSAGPPRPGAHAGPHRRRFMQPSGSGCVVPASPWAARRRAPVPAGAPPRETPSGSHRIEGAGLAKLKAAIPVPQRGDDLSLKVATHLGACRLRTDPQPPVQATGAGCSDHAMGRGETSVAARAWRPAGWPRLSLEGGGLRTTPKTCPTP